MGHLRKLGKDRWQARYTDPSGNERAKNFRREQEAKNFLIDVEKDKLSGDWVDPRLGRTPFRIYAEAWLNTKMGVRERTLINIEGRLRNHLLPAFGRRPIGGIRPTDIRIWVKALVDSGRAPGTVKAAYLILNQIMRTAVIDRYIYRSPCEGIELPRLTTHEEMHFLSPEEVRVLAEAITPRYRALIYAAAYTGMRAGELGALRLDRLNLLHGTLDVVASLSEIRGRLEIGPTKTGKNRTLLIPRFLVTMLDDHIRVYPSAAGFVFSAAEGGPLRHRNFYRRHFKPTVAEVGLPPDLRFHDLRHTCAALLIADGRHMEEVKEFLGHSSIRVTSDRYGHLFPKARQAMRDGLDCTFVEASDVPLADLRRTLDGLLGHRRRIKRSTDEADTTAEHEDSLERTTGFEPATLTLAR